PSGDSSVTSPVNCSLSADTRIIKNSSTCDEKIERNFSRSNKGCASSCASSSTRRKNSNKLSSRLNSNSFAPHNTGGSAICRAALHSSVIIERSLATIIRLLTKLGVLFLIRRVNDCCYHLRANWR